MFCLVTLALSFLSKEIGRASSKHWATENYAYYLLDCYINAVLDFVPSDEFFPSSLLDTCGALVISFKCSNFFYSDTIDGWEFLPNTARWEFFFGWFDTSSGLKNLGEFSSRVTQSRLWDGHTNKKNIHADLYIFYYMALVPDIVG